MVSCFHVDSIILENFDTYAKEVEPNTIENCVILLMFIILLVVIVTTIVLTLY